MVAYFEVWTETWINLSVKVLPEKSKLTPSAARAGETSHGRHSPEGVATTRPCARIAEYGVPRTSGPSPSLLMVQTAGVVGVALAAADVAAAGDDGGPTGEETEDAGEPVADELGAAGARPHPTSRLMVTMATRYLT
jgi:hypothetical protein